MINLLEQAHERGIPVVTHNLLVPEAPQAHVAVDNVEAGRLSAETWSGGWRSYAAPTGPKRVV
jgi:ABC-type sugar transport system substrate-binding protein